MKAVERSSQADDLSRDSEFDRQLPLVQIHGDTRNRSAAEIWKWLTFIIKGINRFFKFFKCDNVNIVTAWRPLRQRWKSLEQRRKARKHSLDDSMHLDPLDSEDDASVSSSKTKEKISPGQGKGWMKRLIIRGLNGKGPNKRGIEFEGDGRRTWLTRKRRRIGRVGWVKQQQKESREPGLRVFLRSEESYKPGGESNLERAKGSPDYTTTTPSHFVPFETPYSQEDDVAPGKVPDTETERDNEASSQPAHDETVIQLLPDELVDKVLGRLPLTSVLRFRSVCRRWQSRLSPEGWCSIFPQHSPPSWTACPALFTSGNSNRQCAFYDLSTRKWSCIYLDFLPDSACHLLAASGGLICLCFSGMNSTLFICNPLTKSWRALPDFNHARRRAGMLLYIMSIPQLSVSKLGHSRCNFPHPPFQILHLNNSIQLLHLHPKNFIQLLQLHLNNSIQLLDLRSNNSAQLFQRHLDKSIQPLRFRPNHSIRRLLNSASSSSKQLHSASTSLPNPLLSASSSSKQLQNISICVAVANSDGLLYNESN